MIGNYRWRQSLLPAEPEYAELENKLQKAPKIAVPTITVDGRYDPFTPAGDGSSYRAHFTGKYRHRTFDVGHNVPDAKARLDEAVRAVRDEQKIALQLPATNVPAGRTVFHGDGLRVSLGGREIISGADLTIRGPERIALTGPDLWKGMPEKVLGTTESWAANNPNTLKALIKALIEACLWLDEPSNRAEAARILSSPRYLNMPAEVMARTLELPGFHVFQRDAANFPWRSHADWFLAQMVRWKQAPADTDIKAVADRVYRTDIYRAAAREMGIECPAVDRLPPGGHGEPLTSTTNDKQTPGTSVQEIANG